MTDTVAIAWSEGMHPLTGTDEVGFLYWVKAVESGKAENTPSSKFILEDSIGDAAYTRDIDTDRGLQKDYDIKATFSRNGKDYYTVGHGGTFLIIIVADNSDRRNLPVTYKAQYYHQKISVPWSLTVGADLSIGFGAELCYECSNLLIRNFYYFDS